MSMVNEYRYLKSFPLFAEMTEEELSEIHQLLEIRTYPDGKTLFFQGDRGEGVYFLKKGKIKAIKSSPDGSEQILEILQPGDVFGEVVLFGIEEYPATTVAIGEVEVSFLSIANFRNYFNENPQIGWGMLRVMALKLKRAQHKIKNLGLRDTKGRVATLLIDLLYEFGDSQEEIKLDINRQEMASFIGTTRETVSRTLSEFKNEGLIDIEGNKIYIRDIKGLKEWT